MSQTAITHAVPPPDPSGTGRRTGRLLRAVGAAAMLLSASGLLQAQYAPTVSNTVTVTVPATVTDNNTANNTATDTNNLAAFADLAVSKTLTSASPALAGSTVTYNIVVSNTGPSIAYGATIADTVPAQLTDVTWTCTASGTSTCGTPSGSGNSISLLADVVPGAGNTITVAVSGTAPASGTIGANTATVTPGTGTTDSSTGNNTSSTDPVDVSPLVDLAMAKTLTTGRPAKAFSTVTYTLVVTNAGPSTAVGATIADTVPTELTDVTWTCSATGGSSCGTASGTGNVSLLADVTSGGSVTVTVSGTAPATGTIGANTATVTAGTGTTETNTGNNSDTEGEITVQQLQADISVSKSDGASTYTPGGTASYTITVSNAGPDGVTGVTVSDTLPAGVTLSGAWSCSASVGSACSAASGGTAGGSSVSLTVDVANGGTVTITVPVSFSADPAAY